MYRCPPISYSIISPVFVLVFASLCDLYVLYASHLLRGSSFDYTARAKNVMHSNVNYIAPHHVAVYMIQFVLADEYSLFRVL